MFKLDPQLQNDTIVIGNFPLCQLLLMNDKQYPWFILVPRRNNMAEIFELSAEQQQQLLLEMSGLGKLLANLFQADKMNIANLGNVVSQLHVHVIARHKTDPSWPAPVWGKHAAIAYNKDELENIVNRLKTVMPDDFSFV